MPRREILTYPDSRLRVTAAPVTDFGEDFQRLVDDLIDTLADRGGLGLSATQVDDHRRALVIQPPGSSAPTVYVNPAVTARAAWGFVEESCLSVPGVVGSVIRPTQVSVLAQDRTGARLERRLEGMDAVCLQHEIDHLDGRLFFDRFSFVGRWRVRARLGREARVAGASAAAEAAGAGGNPAG